MQPGLKVLHFFMREIDLSPNMAGSTLADIIAVTVRKSPPDSPIPLAPADHDLS